MKKIWISLLLALTLLLTIALPAFAKREWLSSDAIGGSGSYLIQGVWSYSNTTGSQTAISVKFIDPSNSGAGVQDYSIPASQFTPIGAETIEQVAARINTLLQDEFSTICELKWFHGSDSIRDKNWVGDGLHEIKWQDPNTMTIYYKYVGSWFKVNLSSLSPLIIDGVSYSDKGPLP